jgi:DNA polymerase
MRTIFIDVEARSTIHLRTAGHFRYAAHPQTEVLCAGLAVDDGEPMIWAPGDPVPRAWCQAAKDRDKHVVVAHNAGFELAIVRSVLAPRHGWPIIPTKHWQCTMAVALSHALPGGLENAAVALGLTAMKDAVGRRVMLQLSKPRRARRGEDPSRTYWFEDTERVARLEAYCKQDIEVTRAIWKALKPLSAPERRLWLLDQAINRRGLAVDLELVERAAKWVRLTLSELAEELSKLTSGEVTSPAQIARLTTWCASQGAAPQSLTAESVAKALKANLPPPVHRALEIRQAAASASVKKYKAILDWAGADGRLRGMYRFHGASTGRWSGSGPQPQNLRRVDGDPGPALAALQTGVYAKFREQFPNLLDALGGLTRPMVIAGKGRRLIGADFKLIEIAVMAWLCGDNNKIATLRKVFAGEGEDLHTITAAKLFRIPADKVTPEQRSGGKIANFACQYQGGAKAILNVAHSYGITLNEAQAEEIKNAWRAANPLAVRFWSRIDRAAIAATRTVGRVMECGPLRFRRADGFLRMRLPSGRKIAFPRPCLVANGDREVVSYHDSAGGRFMPVKNGHGAYGGLFTENAVSGIARDLLRAALVRLDRAGFNIVAHCHDELTAEVDRSFTAIREFQSLMEIVPRWGEGLPVACEIWGPAARYIK